MCIRDRSKPASETVSVSLHEEQEHADNAQPIVAKPPPIQVPSRGGAAPAISPTRPLKPPRTRHPNPRPNQLLSLIHISEPTRLLSISYAVFCLKKKKQNN
eukprot:TRINITY_DN48119_c0_g1_i1.p2 TRINITY_DN48119_c0_g1~~TRINITY_DN48119_c0_g1_i1.p2  ORF type:complete len:101 (+),score=29.77 TRINITY_DN48119_c0_g1_i1:105-407(+)